MRIYFEGSGSPLLIDKSMLKLMKPGSVVVDLASSFGGNVELTKEGIIPFMLTFYTKKYPFLSHENIFAFRCSLAFLSQFKPF